MPSYRLVIPNHFRRDLRQLDVQTHRRVLKILETLRDNPHQGTKLTKMVIGQWRIRVGDWRIRYDIENDAVLLYRVRHRRDIYHD
jgi:mRNA interferase RelE/StbE